MGRIAKYKVIIKLYFGRFPTDNEVRKFIDIEKPKIRDIVLNRLQYKKFLDNNFDNIWAD